MTQSNIQYNKTFFPIILILTILLTYMIRPILIGILIGIILAYICKPVHTIVSKYISKPKWLASLIATITISVPTFSIVCLGIMETINMLIWLVQNQTKIITTITNNIQSSNYVSKYIVPNNKIIEDLMFTWLQNVSTIIPVLNDYLYNSILTILNIIIAIVVCFSLLKQGNTIYRCVSRILPDIYKPFFERFASHLDTTLSGIFVGNALTAVIVGLVSSLIFWIYGFENIFALASLIFLGSIIPLFGGYMVLIALSGYLYFTSSPFFALQFFIVSCIVIYAPPELFLRPYITSIKTNISPILLMITFIGGMISGGMVGFIIAPIILAIIISLYEAYTTDNTSTHTPEKT